MYSEPPQDTLHNRVIGQEEAVTAIAKAVRRARAGLQFFGRRGPLGRVGSSLPWGAPSFLSLGPRWAKSLIDVLMIISRLSYLIDDEPWLCSNSPQLLSTVRFIHLLFVEFVLVSLGWSRAPAAQAGYMSIFVTGGLSMMGLSMILLTDLIHLRPRPFCLP